MIVFNCPACQKKYRVPDDFAGKKAKCKQCQGTMEIPFPVLEVELVEEAPPEPQLATPLPSQVATAPTVHQPAPIQPVLAQPIQTQPIQAQPVTARFVENDVISAEVVQAQVFERPKPKPPRAANQPQVSHEVLRGASPNFSYEISQRPDFSLVTLRMEQGQKVYSEPSAMAAMTPTIKLKAGLKGGFRKTLGRALGGESVIINTLEAATGPGEASFAPGIQGDVAHYSLQNNSLYLQRGAFLLHSEGVELTGKWQGAKGFFSGEGLVLLKASGTGDLFFNSYGAILSVDVTDQYYVDTGYVVAFEDTLQYGVTVLPGLRAGGKVKSLFFGGEGLVCQFSGQGRVWIQTRHPSSFISWVNPFRPTKKNN
ncbi:MAG: TIGR00266 family protein [Pirellulaceae bacterium]|nr:TIGR00266 family protein [Pirellulaceae bacterium]